MAALEDPRVVALCLLDPVDNTVHAPLAPDFPSAVAALQGFSSPGGSPSGSSSSSNSDSSKSRSRGVQPVSSSGRNTCTDMGETGGLVGEDRARGAGIGGGGTMGSASSDGGRTGVSACASLPASFPVAVVGSGIGGDCAPSDANYRQFFNATRGPTWEVSLKNAGHFQYLDVTPPLLSYICPAGSAPDEEVRHIACGVMVAWAELCLRHRGHDVLRGAPLPQTRMVDGFPPSVPSASATASYPGSGSQQGTGVPGNGSGFADRMLLGKDGPPGMVRFEGTAGAPGPDGGSQGPGDNGSGNSYGSSSTNGSGQIYPYACLQGPGGVAAWGSAATGSPLSAPGVAFPWSMQGSRLDAGSDGEGLVSSKSMGNLPLRRPLSFDSSLPGSLDAALRGQGLHGIDVATRYKAFGDV
ncbi:hypothetical protein DUNSADRAFT_2245 [Dunaliella salina]|uniref:Uncharacterized protein n=1 Tax=Dunaliella salina TaxID=3046 RepID=A0ABQ7GW65_DUNSA|nr:hypothetical protein DUNSADRAFT_2245 [Dunaliella salina]|eukprot:KAF5838782.1 hypothetical protein DUNSADRAFT_2245 [Dunaliella salina]